MLRTTLILFLLISIQAKSQVYPGTGGAIQNNGQDTYFNLTVSGIPPLNSSFGLEEVCVNISHPALNELQVYLQSPGGTMVQLTEGSSCNGANYTSTCFNMAAGISITVGTAPYSGMHKPVGYLGRFNNGQAGIGSWKLIIKDYLAFTNAGTLTSWNLRFGNAPAPPVSFTSSDLPIVVINTNSQSISDIKILAELGIIYNGPGIRNYMTDPLNHYNGHARIGLRGNSSKHFEKKPYAFETTDAAGTDQIVSLLGMPAESDWVLLALYQDKSLIRIPMTYDFSRKMGNYAARFRMVELVLNNEYRGVYALMEKIKRDEHRVNIPKLSPTENTSPAITGGYIIKIDRTDEPGWTSLFPGDASNGAHFYYQYVYPKDSITVQQQAYIKNYLDTLEGIMNDLNFYKDPWAGYQKYIDLASLVDVFIMNELSKNVDGYRLSTYLYKDKISKGGKLHMGPVWDYDLAWHNCNYANSFDPTGWQYQIADTNYPTPIWWSRFMQDTSFTNTLYCRWTQLRQNALSNNRLYAYIDSFALALNESQQRNFTQWPILGAYIQPNPQNQAGANYQGEITDLKTWIGSRVGWLDWAITGHCPIIGVNENNPTENVVLYPNPSNGVFNLESHITLGNDASIEVYNVFGEKIYSANGALRQIDISTQPSGIYFCRVKDKNNAGTGKMIVR